MKHIIYLTITLLSLITNCFAGTPPDFRVFKISEANAYRVIYANPGSGIIELEIMNSSKRPIYSAVYHASRGIKLPLDFSQLENGRYFVSIRDGRNFFIEAIDHVAEPVGITFHAAPLHGDSKKYLISIVTPMRTAVTLSVYDVHGRTLYERNQSIRKQEALVLNLREFKGPFVFELTDAMGKRTMVQR
jgi:hypothetical protein